MSQSSQFSLLTQRRFAPFFWTQFFGAFNDNLFKTALLVMLTFDALNWTSIAPATLNIVLPALFILPYVVFSATAGQIADKVEKSRLARELARLGATGLIGLGLVCAMVRWLGMAFTTELGTLLKPRGQKLSVVTLTKTSTDGASGEA
mgnify:CR=1 FL=1